MGVPLGERPSPTGLRGARGRQPLYGYRNPKTDQVRIHQLLRKLVNTEPMERRATYRNRVLMAGTIEFGGDPINCVIRDMSIGGASLDVTSSIGIPDRFSLVFKADGVRIPCHIAWRNEKRIGVAFD